MRIIFSTILIVLTVIVSTQSNAQNKAQINMQALYEFVNTHHINVQDKGRLFSHQCSDMVGNLADKDFYYRIAPESKSLRQARLFTFASLLKLNSDISNVWIDPDIHSVSFQVKGEPAVSIVIFNIEEIH
jgi:hypothetical protein